MSRIAVTVETNALSFFVSFFLFRDTLNQPQHRRAHRLSSATHMETSARTRAVARTGAVTVTRVGGIIATPRVCSRSLRSGRISSNTAGTSSLSALHRLVPSPFSRSHLEHWILQASFRKSFTIAATAEITSQNGNHSKGVLSFANKRNTGYKTILSVR